MRTRWANAVAVMVAAVAAAFLAVLLASLLLRVEEFAIIAPHVGVFRFWSACVLGLLLAILLTLLVTHNRLYRSPRYWSRWIPIAWRLRRQFIDARVDGSYATVPDRTLVRLPRLRLTFDDGYTSGELWIENTIRISSKLESAAVSAALGRYVVEEHYMSPDENWYVYKLLLVDGRFKKRFGSLEELLGWAAVRTGGEPEKLAIDERTVTKYCHILLSGVTGSGKTMALRSIIEQLRAHGVALTVCDPKATGLAAWGREHYPDTTADTCETICQKIKDFRDAMEVRQMDMLPHFAAEQDPSYMQLGHKAQFLIIDEYAVVAEYLRGLPKAQRDPVNAALRDVVMMGRQLGFFVVIAMQQANAADIPTAVRDQMGVRFVLGRSQPETYRVCFANATDLPERSYRPGEGLFETVSHPFPRLCWWPHLAWLDQYK